MISQAERRQRRSAAIAAIEAGEPIDVVAERCGLAVTTLRVYRSKKGPTSASLAKRMRRIAILKELAAYGCTRSRCAALTGASIFSINQFASAYGIVFPRDKAGLAPVIRNSKARTEKMVALYRAGFTLQQIGEQFGVTRERVRQLMKKYFGLHAEDGGAAMRSRQKREATQARKDANSLQKNGCLYADYVALRDMKKPTAAFISQKNNARKRGIGFELTLWQWWQIWQASGHWDERGRGQGYVMCRKGDVGPYAVGNVFIAPGWQNSSDKPSKKSDLPTGVSAKNGRYIAKRMIDGQLLHLGTFGSALEAHAAYLAARAA